MSNLKDSFLSLSSFVIISENVKLRGPIGVSQSRPNPNELRNFPPSSKDES